MTTTDTTVNDLVINVLTKAQYNAIPNKSSTELYMVTDADDIEATSVICDNYIFNSGSGLISGHLNSQTNKHEIYCIGSGNTPVFTINTDDDTIETITPSLSDNSNKVATTSFVQGHIYKPIVDYSNGITPTHPTSSSKFTAPSDGIFVDCFYYGTDNINYLYINSTKTDIVNITASSNRNNRCSVIVPLAQGDEIYWDCGATNTYAIGFYPYLYNSV